MLGSSKLQQKNINNVQTNNIVVTIYQDSKTKAQTWRLSLNMDAQQRDHI